MTADKWAQWLLVRRDGADPGLRARHATDLESFRDGVLDRAALEPSDVLLDVGCGTGLIGFGALSRLGPGGRVIFSDISADLLDECRRTADGDPRAGFVLASASDLSAIPTASVDAVTLRSVLMYSDQKQAAFAEFFRVLRPGGRLSLFEPINQFLISHGPARPFGIFDSPVDDLLVKIGEAYRTSGAQAASHTMVDFDERDLLAWAAAAGFAGVELDYRAQLRAPAEPIDDWEAQKRVAPNPLAPTFGEAIDQALTESEKDRLEAYMTDLVNTKTPTRRTMAVAFLRALHP